MGLMDDERQWCAQNPAAKAPAALPHLIPMVFGDWSNDGGGETTRLYFWSNCSISAWREALIVGCEAIDVDLINYVASTWREPTIAVEDLQKLRDAGFSDPIESEGAQDMGDEDEVEINFDEFKAMVLFAIQKGDPAIRFVEIDKGPWAVELHPGGYGLLGS